MSIPRYKVVARFEIGGIRFRILSNGTIETCWRGLVLFHD